MPMKLHKLLRDSAITFRNHRGVWEFVKVHKLWQGILEYRWLSKFLILAGVLMSLQLLSFFIKLITSAGQDSGVLSASSGLFTNIWEEASSLFAIGGMKYVVLILLEVVIFHFSRRTLEVMTGDSVDHSFKAFLRAQVRMIGISIYSFIMESLMSIVVSIGLSMLLLGTVKPVAVLLIQCYYLGFAIVDNYNEVYGMSLKQSARLTKEYWGVAIVTGIFVYVLMLVPVAGTVAGPIAGAVAATITMHQLTQGGTSIEWVFEER